jgi:YidC/Oxa1 family membrane protein insertase
MMVWLTYQAWMQDYGPQPVVAPTATEQPGAEQPDAGLPELGAPGDELPAIVDNATIDAPDVLVPGVEPAAAAAVTASSPAIRVNTDVFAIEISTQGGTLQSAKLQTYPVAKDRPDELVNLLSTEAANVGLIQTGLRSAGDGPEANHLATFSAEQAVYDIGSDEELQVRLSWSDGSGIEVEKSFAFKRGSYRIDVTQTVTNSSAESWRGAEYAQLKRRLYEQERSMFDVDSYSTDGAIAFDGEKSEKYTRDDLQDDGPIAYASDAGWFGAIQHHFVSAVIPAQGVSQRFNITLRGDASTASVIGPAAVVNPGESKTFTTTVFVGPKLQSQLAEIHPKLTLTVDYGWLTILSQPLFWLLSKVYDLVANWGVSIIVVTLLIKLLFYKLTESSGRSMAKMRNLQPRLKALQDRYKDDKQQLSQAMMELYKREKVNPAAGCLPILIQMPFFLAFYWVLLESVEMRQAPFALWLTDLSTRDPYFILPLIMGGAMFFQQKLNPQVGDPVQVKVMQIMPIIFTAFFAFFPSGLVLYWVTNTLLSIAQQWKINKVVEAEAKAQKTSNKPKKS